MPAMNEPLLAERNMQDKNRASGSASGLSPAARTVPEHQHRAGQIYAVPVAVCLVLIAFNLRPLFSSLAALLPEILGATGISAFTAGLLTTLPVFCLGFFAPLAPRYSESIGMERTLLLAVLLLAAGTFLRGTGTVSMMFAGTMLAGACIAVCNVLLPALVKRDFPDKAALLTGFYTMALSGGAALAAAFTLPAYKALGNSWQMALGLWALPALVVALFWGALTWRQKHQRIAARGKVSGLWRDKIAWQLTLFMGLQSSLAYTVFGWLSPILRERGMDGITAGAVVSVAIGVQLFSCLIVPTIAVRSRNQSLLNVVLIISATIATLAMLFMPLWSVWYWAILQGIGLGGLIAAAMTEIVLRSPDPRVASHLSGMVQFVGYMIASAVPLLIGIIHDFTGSYNATAFLFVLIGLVASWSGWGAGRALHVRTSE
ncbi:CynX/NimT family MFS transporter [Pseudochrobactrum sp. HB0163]|uniref:CynX/NimT family MFS transporter n=1 Tax=Pseudochrobactrum sp. HB0163 TaxID=3450708 RepID=UPI003F6DAECC